MPLKYPSELKFGNTTETIDDRLDGQVFKVIMKISKGHQDRKEILEIFKSHFAGATGNSSGVSTSESWAETDLGTQMNEAKGNAAAYLAAFWDGIEEAQGQGAQCPTLEFVNDLIKNYDLPFVIKPPYLEKIDNPVTSQTLSKATYARHEQLGQGGYGTVYRVTRESFFGPQEFAMKVLDPSAFAGDPEKARTRFKREVGTLSKIQHRGIVQYLDAGFDEVDRPFIIMALIHGKDIRTFGSSLTCEEKCALLAEVLLAIGYAHQRSICHRDLKPSNILVRDADGQPVIVDFGSAYLVSDRPEATITTTAVGTAGYIAPYVSADPRNRSPKQDLFSIGVIAYELFMNRKPDPLHYTPISNSFPHLSPLDTVFRKSLASQETTFESALDFREELLRASREINEPIEF